MFFRKKKSKIPITGKPYLENERAKIIADVRLRHSSLMAMLEGWNGEGNSDVTKSEMRDFPLLEWVNLSEGVKIRKRLDLFKNILVFDTVMKQGKEFGLHKHSDCVEVVDVLEGELVDLATGKKYIAGEQIYYEKGIRHLPLAITFTKLTVYFR